MPCPHTVMRFGFATIPAGSLQDSLEVIRVGERLGYDVAWAPDQTFHRDCYVFLAAAGHATTRIRLGIGATNPYTRHPAVTARAAATLDEVCGGRLILALSAGNRKELLEPLGFGDRAGPRCREAALVIRQLLRGETVQYHSDTLLVEGVRLECPPRPNVPVYLAARGPRILRAAGEVADGVIIGALVSPEGMRYALDRVREGARRAGRGLEEFEIVSWVTCVVTDDRRAMLEHLRPLIAHVIGGAPQEALAAVGLDMDAVARLKAVYQEGGPLAAAPHVPAEAPDRLALVGDPEFLVERIRALRAEGVTQVVVLMPARGAGSHGVPEFDHARNLERFAREVMPRV